MKLDSMNKKNQYKFLYDVLGNSIIVENLINEDCSENNQKGNILINPKKEQYLKFTFLIILEIIAKTILLLFILNQE